MLYLPHNWRVGDWITNPDGNPFLALPCHLGRNGLVFSDGVCDVADDDEINLPPEMCSTHAIELGNTAPEIIEKARSLAIDYRDSLTACASHCKEIGDTEEFDAYHADLDKLDAFLARI